MVLLFSDRADPWIAQRIFSNARQIVRNELSIDLQQWSSYSIREPRCHQGCSFEAVVGNWEQVARQYRDFDMVLIFVSSKLSRMTQELDGFAEGRGAAWREKGGFAIVSLGNSERRSQRALLHEIGHLLGAGHSESGIMTPVGGESVPLQFCERSRHQIRIRQRLPRRSVASGQIQ